MNSWHLELPQEKIKGLNLLHYKLTSGQVDIFLLGLRGTDLVYTKGITWHTDDYPKAEAKCAMWVIKNDGFAIESKEDGVYENQVVGSVILLDINKPHRCKSIDRKTKGKIWAAVSIGYENYPDGCVINESLKNAYNRALKKLGKE